MIKIKEEKINQKRNPVKFVTH